MKRTQKTESVPMTESGGQEKQAAVKPKRGRKPRAVKEQGAEPVQETAAGTETAPEQENAAETEGSPMTDAGGQEKQAAVKPKRGRKPRAVKEHGAEPVQETAAGTETAPEQESAAETENVAEDAPETKAEPVMENTAEAETESVAEDTARTEGEPASALVPVEAAVSPLKRMKQEFRQRALVIREQMQNIQNAFITIGFQLHWIRENNMFRVLGYKNVYEYAEKEYGIKKTTCCNFISIIENYADRDENGQVIESIADCYRNYSASQLVAMLGMTDEMKEQVTPDMSVRAISRLRKGEPETSGTEAAVVMAQEPAPAKDSGAESALPEEDAPAYEEAQAAAMQEPDGTAENPESGETLQPADEDAETDGSPAAETGTGTIGDGDGTLAEIDSYSDYRSMADELDLIMRHVFAASAAVRVRIVCVQG